MNDEKQEQQLAFNSRASLCQGSAELLEVYGNKLERNSMIILMQGRKTPALSLSGKCNIMFGLLNIEYDYDCVM